jgi:hypothetical protein
MTEPTVLSMLVTAVEKLDTKVDFNFELFFSGKALVFSSYEKALDNCDGRIGAIETTLEEHKPYFIVLRGIQKAAWILATAMLILLAGVIWTGISLRSTVTQVDNNTATIERKLDIPVVPPSPGAKPAIPNTWRKP